MEYPRISSACRHRCGYRSSTPAPMPTCCAPWPGNTHATVIAATPLPDTSGRRGRLLLPGGVQAPVVRGERVVVYRAVHERARPALLGERVQGEQPPVRGEVAQVDQPVQPVRYPEGLLVDDGTGVAGQALVDRVGQLAGELVRLGAEPVPDARRPVHHDPGVGRVQRLRGGLLLPVQR